MCNCGPRRLLPPPRPFSPVALARPLAATPRPRPVFEYVGATALTVIGPGSGLRYRFDHRGASLAVDPRDSAALAAVPSLRPLGETPGPATPARPDPTPPRSTP